MTTNSRKTKIVATIGPASEAPDLLTQLIQAGMDVARLNLSHGTHEIHLARIQHIREIAKREGRTVSIIGDLQGPKMRIGQMPEEGITLITGDDIVLDTQATKYTAGIIPLPSPIFEMGSKAGDTIFFSDGQLSAQITDVKEGHLFTVQMLQGGHLSSHKGVNAPGLTLRESILEEKDRNDIAFGISAGVDYFAVSFVRNAGDMEIVRKLIGAAPIKLIAKIERPEALVNIAEIVAASDAIMVARGDLGIETPLWEVPIRQKEIIRAAHQGGKPVIVATQMIESMIHHPIPTRAEVSDIANAVYDSANAVMLSGESANGKYPIQSVQMMDKILTATEGDTTARQLPRFDQFSL